MRPDAAYFIILLCLTPGVFTPQWECATLSTDGATLSTDGTTLSSATQWVKRYP